MKVPRPTTVTLTAELLIGLFIAYGYWIVFTAILLDNAGLPIRGSSCCWPSASSPRTATWTS